MNNTAKIASNETDIDNKLLLLAECFLFRHLESLELEKFVASTNLRSVLANEIVIQKYDQSTEMYIIVSGRVSLTTTSDKGKDLSLGVLGEGNIFGEMSLFDKKERSATITAIEPSKFLVISQKPFVKLVNDNPKIALKLLAAMAGRLRYANQSIEEKYFGQVHVRLAKKIVALAKIYGSTAEEGIAISIQLSYSDLAKPVGISIDNVSRQLKRWQDKGILKYDDGSLVILKLDDLKSLN